MYLVKKESDGSLSILESTSLSKSESYNSELFAPVASGYHIFVLYNRKDMEILGVASERTIFDIISLEDANLPAELVIFDLKNIDMQLIENAINKLERFHKLIEIGELVNKKYFHMPYVEIIT